MGLVAGCFYTLLLKTYYMAEITDFSKCPHCGNAFIYFTRVYVSGWVNDQRKFADHQPYNPELYDYLHYSRETKYYYCEQCKKRICKRTTK